MLRSVDVLLIIFLLALKLLLQRRALPFQTSCLFWVELVAIGLKPLANIIDLLIEIFEVGLARSELTLQFAGSLLALCRGDDRGTNVKYTDFGGCSSGSRRRLSAYRRRADQARRSQRGRKKHLIHSSLLIVRKRLALPYYAN